MPCSRATFYPRPPPDLPEVHGGPARSLGQGGWARWSLASEAVAGWAGGLHPQQSPGSLDPSWLPWIPGDARRLLLAWQAALDTLKDPVLILLKVSLGFWRLARWQQTQSAFLAYPENALSGCLAFRRTRTKFEGFKGRAAISKIRGSHRLRDWRGTFPKIWTSFDLCNFFWSLLQPAAKPESWY